jgi:hypothetical protein
MLTDGFDYVLDASVEYTDEEGVILKVLGYLSFLASSLGSSVSYLGASCIIDHNDCVATIVISDADDMAIDSAKSSKNGIQV